MNSRTRLPVGTATGLLALVMALAGCGTGGAGSYAGARAQADRAAADAALEPGAGAPQTPALHVRLIEQMQRDGLWFASLAHVDALEQRWGATPSSTRLRADALRRTDQPEAARTAYEKLVGTPLEATGYHGLGLLAAARRDDAGPCGSSSSRAGATRPTRRCSATSAMRTCAPAASPRPVSR